MTLTIAQVREQDYDLSIGDKEIVHDEAEHRLPSEILGDLERPKAEVAGGLGELRELP
ncbi:MAG: hypothetical protein QM679_02545 [Patulibacter sp.]